MFLQGFSIELSTTALRTLYQLILVLETVFGLLDFLLFYGSLVLGVDCLLLNIIDGDLRRLYLLPDLWFGLGLGLLF